jgi:hypothetical protein
LGLDQFPQHDADASGRGATRVIGESLAAGDQAGSESALGGSDITRFHRRILTIGKIRHATLLPQLR